jgi:hypothetical protein
MAAAPVKAPESLAESQMRQLDNQEGKSRIKTGTPINTAVASAAKTMSDQLARSAVCILVWAAGRWSGIRNLDSTTT